MLAFIRPESCSVPHTSDRVNLARPLSPKFGDRMRRQAASGRCYACDAQARGVAPRDASGGPWRRKQPPTLRPACARHMWAEFQYTGAKRPAATCEAPEARIYLARSDKRPPRALSAGFVVYRHDTGEILCAGEGTGDKRVFWHQREGHEMQPKREILEAVLTTENAVSSGETSDSACDSLTASGAYCAGLEAALDRGDQAIMVDREGNVCFLDQADEIDFDARAQEADERAVSAQYDWLSSAFAANVDGTVSICG